MKSLLIALSVVSACCLVGCSGGDADTEPIKPSANAGVKSDPSNPRPADPNSNVANVGGAAGQPAQPVGETKSSTVTKN